MKTQSILLLFSWVCMAFVFLFLIVPAGIDRQWNNEKQECYARYSQQSIFCSVYDKPENNK